MSQALRMSTDSQGCLIELKVETRLYHLLVSGVASGYLGVSQWWGEQSTESLDLMGKE